MTSPATARRPRRLQRAVGSLALLGGLLAPWAVPAAVVRTEFGFGPLRCSWTDTQGQSHPCEPISISGEFWADDRNGDGQITLEELVRLRLLGIDAPGTNPVTGAPQRVHWFHHDADHGPAFSADNGWRQRVVTGDAYAIHAPGGSVYYHWADDTRTSVNGRWLPEPPALASLLAAAVAAALAGRGRRRRCGTLAACPITSARTPGPRDR